MGATQAAWTRLEQRLDAEFDDLGRQLQAMVALIERTATIAEAVANRPVVTGDQLATGRVRDEGERRERRTFPTRAPRRPTGSRIRDLADGRVHHRLAKTVGHEREAVVGLHDGHPDVPRAVGSVELPGRHEGADRRRPAAGPGPRRRRPVPAPTGRTHRRAAGRRLRSRPRPPAISASRSW